MKDTSRLIFPVVLLILSGCASKSRPQPTEYFSTRISGEGVRQFAFSLEFEQKKRPNKGEGRDQGRGKGGRGGGGKGSKNIDQQQRMAKLEQRALTSMDSRLSSENYCQYGYEVLDVHRAVGYIAIRGQCKQIISNQPDTTIEVGESHQSSGDSHQSLRDGHQPSGARHEHL